MSWVLFICFDLAGLSKKIAGTSKKLQKNIKNSRTWKYIMPRVLFIFFDLAGLSKKIAGTSKKWPLACFGSRLETARYGNERSRANMRRLALARSGEAGRESDDGEAGSESDDEATSMAGSQFGVNAARSPTLTWLDRKLVRTQQGRRVEYLILILILIVEGFRRSSLLALVGRGDGEVLWWLCLRCCCRVKWQCVDPTKCNFFRR
jgi:hypothetical protein